MFRLIKFALLFALLAYGLLVGGVYSMQERLIFPAPGYVGDPQLISDFETVMIPTPDGETLFALHREAPEGAPTIIVFHGNADSAVGQLSKGRLLATAGFGVLLVEYRGYPGSSGSPSEEGLVRDAKAAYDFIASKGSGPIGFYAHSLGTGVALQAAAERSVYAIVLEAPYDSVAALAAKAIWWAPVTMLLKHPFRSDLAIGNLSMPILIMHGSRDRIVPIAHGRLLAAKRKTGTTFREFSGAGHYLFSSGSGEQAIVFFNKHRPER